MNEKPKRDWRILKTILLIITAPVWIPLFAGYVIGMIVLYIVIPLILIVVASIAGMCIIPGPIGAVVGFFLGIYIVKNLFYSS